MEKNSNIYNSIQGCLNRRDTGLENMKQWIMDAPNKAFEFVQTAKGKDIILAGG